MTFGAGARTILDFEKQLHLLYEMVRTGFVSVSF